MKLSDNKFEYDFSQDSFDIEELHKIGDHLEICPYYHN